MEQFDETLEICVMKPSHKLFAFILLAVICTLNSCTLALRRAEKLYTQVSTSNKQFDAIIVPGVPLRNGSWDSVMKARVTWGVYLYKKNIAKNIIFSGGAIYTPYYEAVVMGLYAQKMGVPAANIFYDTLAKHSTENVYYSYLLARDLKFKSLALATDPFQSILLKRYTRNRFRSPIQHIPVNFDILKQLPSEQIFIDSKLAFKQGFRSIEEQESMTYRLMGTMGKQVYYGPDNVLGKL